VASVNLAANSVWTPDFDVFNGDSEVAGDIVTVSADGYTWWSRTGEMSFYCSFDLTDFPFDTQSCYMKFGNFQYDITMVDVYPFSTPMVINNHFTSQEYDVLSVTVQRRVKKFSEMGDLLSFPYLYYYIELQRYPNIYRDSAMLPIIVVTIMVILSLYINDINTRLGCAVTGLLTIIAVQVVIEGENRSENCVPDFIFPHAHTLKRRFVSVVANLITPILYVILSSGRYLPNCRRRTHHPG
jgi:hypothetical protein